jgi:hypothetical protein
VAGLVIASAVAAMAEVVVGVVVTTVPVFVCRFAFFAAPWQKKVRIEVLFSGVPGAWA